MEIELFKKPKKGAVIIQGFPGFGLVSTITTEFLIDHLKAVPIGRFSSDKIPAIAAIHKGDVIDPFGVFYDEKENIIIIRAIASIDKLEKEIIDAIIKMKKDIGAKELISIEGISSTKGTMKPKEMETFYFTSDKEKAKRFEKLGIKELEEGIIIGITALLLREAKESSFIFSESYSEMPDSRAAAKVIAVLDKYLGLDVDFKPLLAKAEKFEGKIKDILTKGEEFSKEKYDQDAGYVG